MTKKKWMILLSVVLAAILLNHFVFSKTNTDKNSTLEIKESEKETQNLWKLEDSVSINHEGTLVQLLEKIESNSSFKINLDISESKKEELNKNFTLIVDMKVYEIIGLASQSMGLNVVISDDFKEVLIHD
tara:strand:- start:2106 stop:2495 length:390 start_codon:yes stop_codon:yes gene_type:complete